MFKDECGGKQIEEFAGLRPKLYSYKMNDKEEKCKGVKKSVIRKKICHEDFKNCLFSDIPQMRTMNVIRHRKHDLFTEQINKIALSANDDKRVILEDKVRTLAIGHYKFRKISEFRKKLRNLPLVAVVYKVCVFTNLDLTIIFL